jgi:hypothetical protein
MLDTLSFQVEAELLGRTVDAWGEAELGTVEGALPSRQGDGGLLAPREIIWYLDRSETGGD